MHNTPSMHTRGGAPLLDILGLLGGSDWVALGRPLFSVPGQVPPAKPKHYTIMTEHRVQNRSALRALPLPHVPPPSPHGMRSPGAPDFCHTLQGAGTKTTTQSSRLQAEARHRQTDRGTAPLQAPHHSVALESLPSPAWFCPVLHGTPNYRHGGCRGRCSRPVR